jgi:hypothetical protein
MTDRIVEIVARATEDELRVHDCLYGYCPKRWEECARCDAVKAAMLSAYKPEPEGQWQDFPPSDEVRK